MRDAVFAFIWLALLPMSVISAQSGVMLWIWVALASPGDSLYGMLAGLPFNKMVAIITILTTFISREKKDPYLDATLVLMLCLVGVATLSWFFALSPTDEGTDLYQKLVKEVVLALLLAYVVTTRLRIHLIVLILVFSIGLFSVREGLEVAVSGGGHKVLAVGSIGDNNSLATAMLMVVPLMFYLSRYSAVRLIRWGLMAALVLSIIAIVGTYSRGGFIGMVVLAFFLVRNSKNKFASLLVVVVAAGLVYTLAPDRWFHRLDTISEAGEDDSFMGRVVAWKMSLLIALDHPLIGGGPHAVQRLLVWDTYKPLLPRVNFVATPPADIHAHAAHSIWFEMLGDYGFTGLGLFTSMLLLAVWNCRRIDKLTKGDPSLLWASDLARMLQVTMVVFIVTGSALSMGYFELLYIVLALLSRLRRMVLQTLAQAKEDASVGAKEAALALPSVLAGELPRPNSARPQPAFVRGVPNVSRLQGH